MRKGNAIYEGVKYSEDFNTTSFANFEFGFEVRLGSDKPNFI